MNPSSNDTIKITLGPVIGKVTHNSARILVEFNKAEPVTCFLQCPTGETKSCMITSKPFTPIVFTFENLKPKTQYNVHLTCALPVERCSFYTLRENNDNPGNLKSAIVSCNEIFYQLQKTKENDLWGHLGSQVREHSLDYVFHIGDQVYMDMSGDDKTGHIYKQVTDILKATPKKQWDSKVPELLKLLKGQYYKTWNHPSIAFVLANVPNLMICDDHEFRDDWGFKADDYKPGTVDHFYGELARQVYYEYQRQLREDINWKNLKAMKCEYHEHILNGVGVSFMEYRGNRSWFREEYLRDTHMGKAQQAWLGSLYKQGGRFEGLNSAMFITPLPLFLLTHFVSQVAYLKSDDIQEYWTYDSVDQLAELLDLLRTWKERVNGREIVVIGGDFHLGGWTDIGYKGKKIFSQFTTSAISQDQTSGFEKAILDVLMKLGKLNKEYSFSHYGWTKENNYGVVEASTENKVAKINSTLVFFPPQKN